MDGVLKMWRVCLQYPNLLPLSDRLKKRIVVPNLVEPEKSPYGTPATYVDLVADHLTDSFDFSMVNDVLCQFKHFKTVIGEFSQQNNEHD